MPKPNRDFEKNCNVRLHKSKSQSVGWVTAIGFARVLVQWGYGRQPVWTPKDLLEVVGYNRAKTSGGFFKRHW